MNLGIINSEISANSESSYAYSGGIAGYNFGGTITNCYNTGAVTANSTNNNALSGGIAGFNYYGTITNCYNTGDVTANSTNKNAYSGGIAGYSLGTIENCYNTGAVTGTTHSGGIAGYINQGTITNCYNTGAVTGTTHSGGIAGENKSNGTIENCYNTGAVTGTTHSGGIAGVNEGTIENCYNTGDVTGTTHSGGITGVNEGTIENCYNTGDVSKATNSGGIVGSTNGEIKNCYYLNTCVLNSTNFGTELTSDKMKGLKLLGGDGSKYDLNKGQASMPWSPDIFGVNDDYPILADVPTQINPKDSANKPPQSAVYIILDTETDQAENYLIPIVKIDGTSVKATANNLKIKTTPSPSITSYEWHMMEGISKVETGSPCDLYYGTYYVKVTSSDGYSYTSLTRTMLNTFTVTFDSKGGSDVESIEVDGGKTIDEPEAPTKDNYVFAGWYTSDDKKWDFYSDKVTKNMTLYAVWTPIPEPIYTLCLNSNDSTLQTMRYSGTYATKITLKSASDFGWNNECKFIEWNSKSDGSGVSYKEGDKFSLGSETWNLYAIWSDSSYHTVSFDSNGGNSIPSQSIQDGYRASVPDAPTKQGYLFKHWSLNGTKYDFNQSVKEDITLKAEYEVISYKVTFYYNGEVYYSTVADYNTSLGDRMPSLPSDKDSWNTSENGKGSNFNADSLITSDISIYAVSENSISSILIIGGSAAAILAAIAAWLFMRSRHN